MSNFTPVKLITTFICLVLAGVASAGPKEPEVHLRSSPTANLVTADSLFKVKQYTQSLEIYQYLLNNGDYSPSMLLKMSYIQEGLGHIAQSVYCLNLYYLATSDGKAILKIEDVAKKYNLAGYENSDTSRLVITLRENSSLIVVLLSSVALFLTAFAFYQKSRRHLKPVGIPIALAGILIITVAFTWWNSSGGQGIVAAPSTYLMSAPSSGSKVINIIGEGHRLDILGRNDVWVRVRWNEREVYVRDNELLKVTL